MKYLLLIGGLSGMLFFHQAAAQSDYQRIRSNETRVINGKTYFIHQVKKGQTLYSLSKAYGVDMQDIIDENPELLQGLKTGQTLLIPAPFLHPKVPAPPAEEEPGKKNVPEAVVPLPEKTDAGQPCEAGATKEVYSVALMMHLYLGQTDSINVVNPTSEEIEKYLSFRYIQFYEGFLLAADSMKKAGIHLKLYVYDVDEDPAKTSVLLKRPEMAQMDLFIAMLFHRNFQQVAAYARQHNIPVISPVSEREAQVEGNPMVIKIRPPNTAMIRELTSFLARHTLSRILVIRDNQPAMISMADQVVDQCKARDLDIALTDEDRLEQKLLRGVDNLVVVVSNQKAFIQGVLTRLEGNSENNHISVIGIPRWDLLEGMDLEYLVKARTHVIAPYFIDYSDNHVRQFVNLFQQEYKTDPDILAFQGFDIGWYFLNALNRFGTGLLHCLDKLKLQSLQTVFEFAGGNGNGLENQHWEIYRYEHYQLIRITDY